ncbi:hypothetical protein GGF37_004018, partial [Kickxella alabastrina]
TFLYDILGFQYSNADPGVYQPKSGSATWILTTYVADLLLTTFNTTIPATLEADLSAEFYMKDLD